MAGVHCWQKWTLNQPTGSFQFTRKTYHPLQVVVWDSQIFIDHMLPFGLQSAPKISNTMANALNWCLHQFGIPNIFHYQDDFITIGPPGSPIFQEPMSTLDKSVHKTWCTNSQAQT